MHKYKKIFILSFKIGIGSCAALLLAESLHLEYAISAGTITLLTLMTSKWETLRLSLLRIATFFLTVLLACLLYPRIPIPWLAYGILLTIMVFFAEITDLRSTISVNAVIAAHLMTQTDHLRSAVFNEFFLIIIGIVLAVLLNLFHMNSSHQKHLISSMKSVEQRLQILMRTLASYLSSEQSNEHVWQDISSLEHDIQDCIKEAYDYQNNTFRSHPEYYISYFEMRDHQCQILHNLHYEMKKIRTMPEQAHIVSEYMLYLAAYIHEKNEPEKQQQKLNELMHSFHDSALPQTRESFESHAILYHILMDLEDFLKYKSRFIQELDPKQRAVYWEKER